MANTPKYVELNLSKDSPMIGECIDGPDHGSAIRKWFQNNYEVLPSQLWILHKCDNGKCRNLTHIYLGSPSDNSRDREKRGRGVGTRGMPMDDVWRKAVMMGNSNATIDQVRLIRSSDKSIKELCKELNLGYTVVWKIKTNRTWRIGI